MSDQAYEASVHFRAMSDASANRSDRLVGRRALITGAAGGQGRAVARRFLAEGASVALTDVDGAALRALAQELDEVGPGHVVHAVADAGDEAEAAAAAGIGGLDILYNNAAMRLADRDRPVGELDPTVWERTLAVNVTGAATFAKHALPHLLARPAGGVILNVSSTAALGGDPEAHAYAASKGALLSLTKSIAQRYGPDGLRCVAICPGLIDTPMLAGADESITA